MLERRAVWLGVPGAERSSIYVDAHGQLPHYQVEFGPGGTTISALGPAVLRPIGLDGQIIDCFVDQSPPGPDGAHAVFVEIAEPRPGWDPPPGWSSVAPDTQGLEVAPGLKARLDDWVGELSGLVPDDARRPEWTRAGWFDAAVAWIQQALARAGLPRATEITQYRHWGISALLRVDTPAGRYWMKAVCDHFRREVAITATLSQRLPGRVPSVVAVEVSRGWVLMHDLASAGSNDPGGHGAAYAALRRLQDDLADEDDALVRSGCRRRSLGTIPADLADALADPIVGEWLHVEPGRRDELLAWLSAAVAEDALLDLPDVLIHGDFHPGNVASTGDDLVVFDWSDAAIAKPFLDVVTWASWFDEDPDAHDALWASFASVWSDVLPAERWLQMRPTLAGVAGAYHVASYAGIVRSLDPLRRVEHAGGLTEFFAVLDAVVPRSGA